MVTVLLLGMLFIAAATLCAFAIACPSPVTLIRVLCFLGMFSIADLAAFALGEAPS